MRGILAITGKDFRSLFLSPLFWVISFLMTSIWSGLYHVMLGKFAAESMMRMSPQGDNPGGSLHFQVFAGHIQTVHFFMLLAVVALTMRLFAEEKKQKTMDLLLTSPVTATQIVLGKYFAALLAAWALLAISALYPLATMLVANIEWGPLASSYLGLALLVGVYVAVGMFASSLTESSVLAVIMGLIFSVGLWFIGAFADAVDDPTIAKIFEHLSVGGHFVAGLKGSVSIASIVFFLSMIFLNCFLTQRVVESSRWR